MMANFMCQLDWATVARSLSNSRMDTMDTTMGTIILNAINIQIYRLLLKHIILHKLGRSHLIS
jgi:hypothetical protein